jgi:branched-chain amino acid transport system ATP-binding protein
MHETATPLLQVQGLTIRYGGVVAVSGVDLNVSEGRVHGLIGPNGAGKTSMIDALTGYQRPAEGKVLLAGRDITRMPPHRRARMRLARTFQSVELFDDLTVDENLLVASERAGIRHAFRDVFLPAHDPDRRAVDWAISVAGLASIVDRYPREISHGQRKLVGVGRALAQDPRLVLLDEPAAGLDTNESVELGSRLRSLPDEHGVTVLLVDHDMGLVLGVCDQIMVLDFGRTIAEGSPEEIRKDPRVLEAYLGSQAQNSSSDAAGSSDNGS